MPDTLFASSPYPILYRISPRARRLSIRISLAHRHAIVTLPPHCSQHTITRFVSTHQDWIARHIAQLPPAQPFIPNGKILFRGELYTLIHSSQRQQKPILSDQRRIHINAPIERFDLHTKRQLIHEARQSLETATDHYAAQIGEKVAKVTLRDPASRWGSAVRRHKMGYISFSWRLICAPDFVRNYVAAHECAHLIVPNHSQKFWDLCTELHPDVKTAKRWLHDHGASLHAVGATS